MFCGISLAYCQLTNVGSKLAAPVVSFQAYGAYRGNRPSECSDMSVDLAYMPFGAYAATTSAYYVLADCLPYCFLLEGFNP